MMPLNSHPRGSEITRATERLHAAAARCRALNLLNHDELKAIKRSLKMVSANRLRGGVTEADLLRKAEELEVRSGQAVPPDCVSVPTAEPLTAAGRVDELGLKSQEGLGKKWALICLIEGGVSRQEALAMTGVKYSPRTVRYLLKRFKTQGYAGLIDGRIKANRSRGPVKMTESVQRIVMRVWLSLPAAGPRAVWKVATKECEAAGLSCPGYDSVWRFLNSQRPDVKAMRGGKLELVRKQMRSVARVQLESRANARFQIDHTQLDVWVKVPVGDKWEPSNVWCTALLDEFSRSVAGFGLTVTYPDSWAIAGALRHAIRPKRREGWHNRGIPDVLQTDRGRDFMSAAVTASCAALGIRISLDPPHYPDAKGKIERWFSTLDTGCMRTFPGHKAAIGTTEGAARKHIDELMTLAILNQEMETWIVHDYHPRKNRESGEAPVDRWLESIGFPRMPETEDHLNLLLMQTDMRRVQNVGIDFRRRLYWAPALASAIGVDVRLRYDPDDDDSILVYRSDNDTFLCEAQKMGGPDAPFNTTDVQEARKSHHLHLVERMKARADVIEREGRAKGMKKFAVAKAAELIENEVNAMDDPLDEGTVNQLIEKLRRRRSAAVPGWK